MLAWSDDHTSLQSANGLNIFTMEHNLIINFFAVSDIVYIALNNLNHLVGMQ